MDIVIRETVRRLCNLEWNSSKGSQSSVDLTRMERELAKERWQPAWRGMTMTEVASQEWTGWHNGNSHWDDCSLYKPVVLMNSVSSLIEVKCRNTGINSCNVFFCFHFAYQLTICRQAVHTGGTWSQFPPLSRRKLHNPITIDRNTGQMNCQSCRVHVQYTCQGCLEQHWPYFVTQCTCFNCRPVLDDDTKASNVISATEKSSHYPDELEPFTRS